MTIGNFIKSYPALISIILHLLVLGPFAFCFDFPSATVGRGEQDMPIMHSYVYQNNAVKVEATANLKSKPIVRSAKQILDKLGIRKSTRTFKQATGAMETENISTQQSVRHSSLSQGRRTSELITLIHAAIQKQQRYPQSALQMEREGRATVMFTLHTDGTVSQLQIIKSSGTASLDEAAIAAVHGAVPFDHVDQYLQNSQVYSVDVAFELT